jgi:ureidoglycolate lyase
MPTDPYPSLAIQPLSAEAFNAYGWMLGKPLKTDGDAPAYTSPASDFWREHLFDTGATGETEVLWVKYRNADETVASLEAHWLTQQAIVPLTAPIIQIVATSTEGGQPNMESLRAFWVPQGEGVCMRPHCWHATRVLDGESTCLMLTRRSTTYDLVVHLETGAPACESAIRPIPTHRLAGLPVMRDGR